ncbi:acyl carrier protein [Bradyrhizobium sp. USDA 4506]
MSNERFVTIASLVRKHLADILFVEPEQLDDDTNFFEFGLDSLMGVEMIKRLKHDLGSTLELTSTSVFENPSIKALTLHLANQVGAQADAKPSSAVSSSAPLEDQRPALESEQSEVANDNVVSILAVVRRHLAEICGLTPSDVDDDFITFNELGMDAAMRVDLIRRLNSEGLTDRSLSSGDTYQYVSVVEFCRYISRHGRSFDDADGVRELDSERSTEVNGQDFGQIVPVPALPSSITVTVDRTLGRSAIEMELRNVAVAAARQVMPLADSVLNEFSYFPRVLESSCSDEITLSTHVVCRTNGEWQVNIVEATEEAQQTGLVPLLVAVATLRKSSSLKAIA